MKAFFETLLKKSVTAFVVGIFLVEGIVFAAVTIPGTCTTPGNCSEIEATLKNLILKNTLKITDSDASNSITLKTPASVATDITLTLPGTTGTLGQTLITDGSGSLSWSTPSTPDTTPAGTIVAFGGTVAPTGWLLCDGSQVSRSTYAGLFTAIGGAFGSGDGTTTFHLPDLRGVFLRGVDGTKGLDPDKNSRSSLNSGGNSGNSVGSYQGDEFANHNHPGSVLNNNASNYGSNNHAHFFYGEGPGAGANKALTIAAQGGNETRGRNVYVHYIIKY